MSENGTAAPAVDATPTPTTPTAPAPAPAAPATLTAGADPGASGTPATPAPAAEGYWPGDWRTKMAGEDKDALKQLERYGSPADIFKKARELEKGISSGKFKQQLPDNPTEADLKAYRQAHGIPDAPEGYVAKVSLPDGVVLGEADKPIAASFAEKVALKHNLPPAVYNDVLAWYYNHAEEQNAKRAEEDHNFQIAAADEMRNEWGPEYRGNINGIKNLFNAIPGGDEIQQVMLTARSEDGRLIGDRPDVMRFLSALVRETNPGYTLVPASGDAGAALSSRKAEIESWMKAKEGSPEWLKYWKDEKVQADYRAILAAEERRKTAA